MVFNATFNNISVISWQSVFKIFVFLLNLFSCLHNDLRSPGYSEAYIHLIQTKNNTHYNTYIVSTVKK
jgi:hypothetical protein